MFISAKGNTVGFTSEGEAVTGQKTKSGTWRVSVVGEFATLSEARNRGFGDKREAIAYAETLIDAAKTEELKWW